MCLKFANDDNTESRLDGPKTLKADSLFEQPLTKSY